MINPIGAWRLFQKPEYVFRPRQILARLRAEERLKSSDLTTASLPWGLTIRIRPSEMIGSAILRLGVFDLGVSEALWRLTSAGDHCLDVGANIGYMTSILAIRAAMSGTVNAFEPHPEIFEELRANVAVWQDFKSTMASICTHELALSEREAILRLRIPQHFDSNRGSASIGDESAPSSQSSVGGVDFAVQTKRLDDIVPAGRRVGVLKLDVEGHELNVLRGAQRLLGERMIRDLVFEEHRPPPTLVTAVLKNCGYELFRLGKSFLGPRLLSERAFDLGLGSPNEAPNYLATTDPQRAITLLRPRGWQVLAG